MKNKTFQSRVAAWMQKCFGPEIAADKTERNHRFLEEALELVQSLGCTKSEARQLVDYVYDRPLGETNQEAGGVMVTLAALCEANGISMHEAGDYELCRVFVNIETIRAKQAAKPKHSPLPEEKPTILTDHWHVMGRHDAEYDDNEIYYEISRLGVDEDDEAHRAFVHGPSSKRVAQDICDAINTAIDLKKGKK